MNLSDRLSQLDRVQRGRPFKIAATAAYALLIVGGLAAFLIYADVSGFDPLARVIDRFGEEAVSETNRRALEKVLPAGSLALTASAAAAIALAVSLVWIWLGIGLTYIALKAAAVGAVAALAAAGAGELPRYLVGGIAGLTFSFVALLELLKAAMAAPSPVFAVARNTLSEALRMRLSIVFIVLLIFGLAALPGLLDPDQPLRYRVQSFIQWGTGGTFWMLALLVISFGVSTVTGDQRRRMIWQTLTKPVGPTQYVLGKWLGTVGLAAVLLLVSASGVFLFTNYLQNTRAVGESAPYIAADPDQDVADDRLLLQTRVLTARVSKGADLPPFLSLENPQFQEEIQRRLEAELQANPTLDPDNAAWRRKFESDLLQSQINAYRSIPPGGDRVFRFTGLQEARERGLPLTFSYRVDAEGNPPDKFYNITIQFGGRPIVRTVGLGYLHNITVPPGAISEDGTLDIAILNGRLVDTGGGVPGIDASDQRTMTLPDEGMAISYPAGSWQLNHLRAAIILWIKLALLAAIAVWAGTFLSFPVASLLTFALFLIGEGAAFLGKAEEYFRFTDREGNVNLFKLFSARFTDAIADLFSLYGSLDPISLVVSGKLISWADLAISTASLVALTAAFLAMGVFTLGRREVAIYSGA